MLKKVKPKLDEKPKIKKQSGTALRENSKQKFKDVINKLGIDEFYTKSDTKQRKYNKFINGIVPEPNFNYMSDLIQLPTTSKGFKWLLVVMDLATNLFDVEPMQNKTAVSTLEAFKNIIKRKILILPEISLKSDGGSEFKSVFNQYLVDHGIWHKISQAYNHKQQAPVEGLNNTIARLLVNYMNDKTLELGKDYVNWDDILLQIRIEVNAYRKHDLNKLKQYQSEHYFDPDIAGKADYKVGDYVYFKVNRPIDIHGDIQADSTRFRRGDRIYSLETRQIVDILYFHDKPYYRYKLFEMPNVSYSAYDLKLAKKQTDTFIVRKIIGVRTVDKKQQYLVWYKGELKKDARWQESEQLIEDGLQDYIHVFERDNKKKVSTVKIAKPVKPVIEETKDDNYWNENYW
jgi:hypothetical protein